MSVPVQHLPFRKEQIFQLPEAKSTLNRFAGIDIPRNPGMAENDFGSPHQDSWCSESVSLDGPTSGELQLVEQYNPFGYTPNMVCNSNNQMIGVSLDYNKLQFWMVVFNQDCNIISATPAGKKQGVTFGGGYFYLDQDDNTVLVEENSIISYPTQDLEARAEIYPLEPNWQSADVVELITGRSRGNTLYSALPVWDTEKPNTYWCLIAGEYDYQNYPNSTLASPAYMAVVEVNPDSGATKLVGSVELCEQWNNNTFAVDESGAYIVTNGLDDEGLCNQGFLWAFGLGAEGVTVRWKTAYENAGYLKPGQKNIGSGTTPTLTETADGTRLVAITDNADPRLNVVVCSRDTGEIVSQVPCFEKLRSADEASLIGVGDTFIVENNFGHYATYPYSQYVPNGPGMAMIRVGDSAAEAEEVWDLDNIHFYAMNMLCRGSGIIFAHTCDWTADISATEGGMYYISAIDSFNGRVVWRIPLGRGVDYCHEYGGIYFNRNGDLYIGTNQFLVSIKNFKNRSSSVKKLAAGDRT